MGRWLDVPHEAFELIEGDFPFLVEGLDRDAFHLLFCLGGWVGGWVDGRGRSGWVGGWVGYLEEVEAGESSVDDKEELLFSFIGPFSQRGLVGLEALVHHEEKLDWRGGWVGGWVGGWLRR